MTEKTRPQSSKIQKLPEDAGYRPGVDVGGADYLVTESGIEIIRPNGIDTSLTRLELYKVQAERASDKSGAA